MHMYRRSSRLNGMPPYISYYGYLFLYTYIVVLFSSSSLTLTTVLAQTAPSPSPSPSPSPDFVFGWPNITTAAYDSQTQQTPLDICPITSIQFRRILDVSPDLPLRIPHSSILVNGNITCGTKSIVYSSSLSNNDLLADDYISLVHIDALATLSTATAVNAQAIYSQFNRKGRRFTAGFRNDVLGDKHQVYVGLDESNALVCTSSSQGQVQQQQVLQLPLFTLYIIGLFDVRADVSTLFPHEPSIVIQRHAPFVLTFAPISSGSAISELVCPFARTPLVRTYSWNLRLCFPAQSTVSLIQSTHFSQPLRPRLRRVSMSSLRLGDLVLDANGHPSRIVMFSHRRRSGRFPFLRFSLSSPNSSANALTVSHGHLVYVVAGCSPNGEPSLVRARHVRKGHCLVVVSSRRRRLSRVVVVDVRSVWKQGLYNPHTASGSIVVNGIATACYTDAVHMLTAHALLAPVRAAVVACSALRDYLATRTPFTTVTRRRLHVPARLYARAAKHKARLATPLLTTS